MVRHDRAAPGCKVRRDHPGVELRANLKSISHRCHLFEVAFIWELTQETIILPLGRLQGGDETSGPERPETGLFFAPRLTDIQDCLLENSP